ncbi:nucleoside-diphosphate-sugar epimerase [Ruminiclostridium sufflavum DSM 19573]|uniref:Nucleoside-diphosphate-sugar epimerase n=1 Tax=Ruminiclostridium sufflavum DSM 19573 TaxID=1121337 RepID=A0A318XKM1_9FIRM|nr:SDR family oxidoreductase [Ruminiclostridium sufflavum]PYG87654.1 nucleoside-diphosphate-sugar epimerase [Ruminiclostridium sufflavum DSM 19573]
MKILLIGGTGTISTAISEKLIEEKHELYLLNRCQKNISLPQGFRSICADINNEVDVAEKLSEMEFDCVADFIAFVPSQLERDYRLFNGKTKQFIFISSASAYQKPSSNYVINEGTPLANPYWEYSRSKIACEDYLMKMYREYGFPVTIVRPSHTYCKASIPLGVHGKNGSYQVIKRMLEGKPVILHGDGTSLWTMTHSLDFAKAFSGLIGNLHAIGEAVQITSDETLSWNQIYKSIANALGVDFKPFYVASDFLAKAGAFDFEGSLIGDKANSVVFDNSKLKKLVPGFQAAIRFDTGIKECVDYIMSHRDCQREDPEFDGWCDKVINALEAALNFVKESGEQNDGC